MAIEKVKKRLGTIVKVSNDLARAHWSTESIWEIRVVSAIASLVQDSDKEFHTYRLPLAILGQEIGRHYEDIRNAIHTLVKKAVEIKGDGNDFLVYSLFSVCGVEQGELVARFDPDLKPLFLNLKEQFTLYKASEIMTLPSIYSQKMFMLLKSWKGRSEVTINIDELHKLLDVPESFKKNFKDFRRRVLEQSHEDINALTSLRFDWKSVKSGRAVASIQFIFQEEVIETTKRTGDEKIWDLQAKSNKCFEKLRRTNKECAPRQRSKTCQYCQKRGRMYTATKTEIT
jgi:plasmid replication initiation protein